MRRIKVFAIIALMGSLLLGCGLGKSSSQKMVEKVTKNTEANDSYGANATLQLQMKIGGQQVNCKEQSELTYIKSPFEFNLRNHKTDVKGNTSDSEVYYNNQKSSNIIYTCMDGESWLKQKYSKKAITNINDQYLVPIGLDVFLSNASSFKKVEGESGICLKGTVEKDKILDVLDNSGVLSLLQIGKLQKEDLSKLADVSVTVHIDQDSEELTELEVDMTKSFQDVVGEMFNQKEKLYEIDSCQLKIDMTEYNKKAIQVPEGLKLTNK